MTYETPPKAKGTPSFGPAVRHPASLRAQPRLVHNSSTVDSAFTSKDFSLKHPAQPSHLALVVVNDRDGHANHSLQYMRLSLLPYFKCLMVILLCPNTSGGSWAGGLPPALLGPPTGVHSAKPPSTDRLHSVAPSQS